MRSLFNWLRRRNLERGLDRELQYHFDRRVADFMAEGLTEAEARRRATFELGGIPQIQEEVRDVWLTRWARDFVHDIRISARTLRHSPSFAITVILSFALGIGATTAIYSLVDQVILHALPVREPERLVLVDWKGDPVANGFGSWNLMSYPLCLDLQKQDRVLEGALCRALTTVNLSTGGEHRPESAELVSGSYFPVLGVRPALGRLLTPDDDRTAGASPVVVLSYDFWQNRMSGASDVIGRKVLVNQFPMTVVGVAAPAFRGLDVGEVPVLWIPASMSVQAIPGFKSMLDRRTRWMQILARLKPGVDIEQARAMLQPWFKALLDEDMRRPEFPRITPERRQRYLASTLEITAAPQGHSGLRRRWGQPLWVLLAATAVLLALACLNVAGLFLARGSAREREISTRLALGASRSRIGRQLLSDSLLLSLAGGALGVSLAPLAIRALISFLPREVAPTALASSLDVRLLLIALGISLAAGIAAGIAPAFQTGRESLVSSLRERSGSGFAGIRLRKVIVTLQIAFTLVLVIGAALFARTLTGLLAKGPGFATSSLISCTIDPLRSGYSREQAARLTRQIRDEIRMAPEVQSAGIARFALLLGGSWNNPMVIVADRRTVAERDINLNAVTPGFFSTLGVRLIAGRDFEEQDTQASAPGGRKVAIVSESFVKQYLAGVNPVGVRIGEGSGPDVKAEFEVVGVVANFSYRGLRDDREQAFFPLLENKNEGGTFYVRVRENPEPAFARIREIVHRADPALPITEMRTLDDQLNRSLNTERMLATLSSAFGTLALLLSMVGLYGVMSFVVSQRRREIGIRLALGSSRGAALRLILRDALFMIASGTAIALPVTVALGRIVEAQLFGVKPADPGTLALAALLLTSATLCAALIPACRAATIDPASALRVD